MYIGRADSAEVASLLKQGHHGCRRRGQLVKIVAKCADPLPANSHETPCTITKKENEINAGIALTTIGHALYVRRKVALYNPALSEVRVDVGLLTREQLAQMKEAVLPSLKRALDRGI